MAQPRRIAGYPAYYMLKFFSWLRIVKNLKPLPERIRDKDRIADTDPSEGKKF